MKFLSAPFIAGVAIAAPANVRGIGRCTQRSTKVSEWTVSDFNASYTFTDPANQNFSSYINFTLANPALDYTSGCQGISNQPELLYGNFSYNCTVPVPSDQATFTFSHPNNVLMINQTWACPSEGSRFWAEGGAGLGSKCLEKEWQNPNWQHGQIYSTNIITCDHFNVKVPVNNMSGVA